MVVYVEDLKLQIIILLKIYDKRNDLIINLKPEDFLFDITANEIVRMCEQLKVLDYIHFENLIAENGIKLISPLKITKKGIDKMWLLKV